MFDFLKNSNKPSGTVVELNPNRPKKPIYQEMNLSKEEWIEVDGYKGLYDNMTAFKNFKYEVGKTYTKEDNCKVNACNYGFHFCLKLEDVFKFYHLCGDNKFFKVKAVVRKKDYERYGRIEDLTEGRVNKLAAKEITLIEKVSDEEVLKAIQNVNKCARKLTIEDMENIYKHGPEVTLINKREKEVRETLKFSDEFMQWLIKGLTPMQHLELYETALALNKEISNKETIATILAKKKIMMEGAAIQYEYERMGRERN